MEFQFLVDLVDAPWQAFHRQAAHQVRGYVNLHRTEPMSTNALVERMFPANLARGDGIRARNRLYKALMTLAEGELADCATRGPERMFRGRKMRPWLWHAPKPERRCSECGQVIAAREEG